MTEEEAAYAFANLCFNHSVSRLAALKTSNQKLAHYTTAENGLRILLGKTIWLRNALVMNDFSEIAHGKKCVQFALQHETGKRFLTIMDTAFPGFTDHLGNWWGQGREVANRYTYLTSLSEIDNDDVLGRLSMWRAYGGPVGGVAIVFKYDALDTNSEKLQAYHSPVLYADEHGLLGELEKIVFAMEGNAALLAAVPREAAWLVATNALHYAMLSTKHPGFAEEKEWRIIYTLEKGQSEWIQHDSESVNGVPQIVCKIPLENKEGLDMPELNFPNLIDRVLIGPCAYPDQVADAYRKALMDGGIKHPRIDVSAIPLRH